MQSRQMTEKTLKKDSLHGSEGVFFRYFGSSAQIDKKEQSEQEENEKLNLFGGCLLPKESERYNSVVPATALEDCYYLDQPDVSRLPQTHVIDVIAGNYPQKYREPVTAVRDSLSECVMNVECNVGAVSGRKGRAFASGVLIAPNLFLTARHAVEKKFSDEFIVRLAYQKQHSELYHGDIHRVTRVVEENEDLDYAILLLEEPVKNFKAIPIEIKNQVGGNTIFIHHANGGPKVVSVHASMESGFYQFMYESFHDTIKGSSGGPYFTSSQKIFGLHLLKDNITGVRWVKEIYERSSILQILYDQNGIYKNVVLNRDRMSAITLPLTPGRFSQKHIKSIERVDKPLGFEKEFGELPAGYSRHHIIPAGDMGFLWFMGEENTSIKHLLKDISYNRLGTIESVEWAPWNLFIGPDNRPQDPIKGDPGEGVEPIRPPSYHEALWDQIQSLYQQIQNCWHSRMQLSSAISDELVNMSTADFRSHEINAMESSRGNNLAETKLKKTSKTTPVADAKKQYLSNQRVLFDSLANIRKIIYFNKISSPHPYSPHDWEKSYDNKYLVKTNQPKLKHTKFG